MRCWRSILRDYAYDVYTQIGIVTLIGLAAKNAILIVEYAKLRQDEGMSVLDAAMEAAQAAAAADSDDVIRIHSGRGAAGDGLGAGAEHGERWEQRCSAECWRRRCLGVFIVPVLYVVVDGSRRDGDAEPGSVQTPAPAGSGD